MNKTVVLASSILLLFSCKNNENKIAQPDSKVSKQKETVVVAAPIEKQTLKNVVIDEKYFEEKTKLAKALTPDQIKAFDLTKIEGIDRDATATIKIIDTLYTSSKSKIVVVAQETENEITAYIVSLDNKDKTIQFEPVFYADFVEYFSSTASKIKDNTIEITTKTDNGEEEQTTKTVTLRFINGKITK